MDTCFLEYVQKSYEYTEGSILTGSIEGRNHKTNRINDICIEEIKYTADYTMNKIVENGKNVF